MRASRMLPLRSAIAGLTSMVVLAPFLLGTAGAARAAAACDRRVISDSGWVTVRVSAFSSGPEQILGYAINPFLPERMFVTNGLNVLRTSDGGCKWADAFTIPTTPSADIPFTSATAHIESIAVQSLPQGTNVVLRVQETLPGGAARPHIVVSPDGGSTWKASDAGLPATGNPAFLHATTAAPLALYLGIDSSDDNLRYLYASTDAGATWSLRVDVANLQITPRIADLTSDPSNPNDLWAWGGSGIYHSGNGGTTFTEIRDFSSQPAGPIDVFHQPPAKARVVAFLPEGLTLMRSNDGGADGTFNKDPSPKGVDAVAHGLGPNTIAASAGGQVYAYFPPTRTWRNLNAPGSVRGVTTDKTASTLTYGFTDYTIEIYQLPLVPPPDFELTPDLVGKSIILTPKTAAQRGASLTPGGRKLVLDPGGHKRIPYRLRMPRTPVPLDVFFLVDTSGSMTNAINGMRRAVAAITNGLVTRNLHVQFGLAEFRTYPDHFPPRSDAEETNFVYRRVLDIGPLVPAAFGASLDALRAEGGGNYDAHLGALYQAATGKGQDLYPPDPPAGLGHDVPPNQDATWRTKALHVIVHVTDERFGESDDEQRSLIGDNRNPNPPEIPSYEEVIDALNVEDIEHVGLSIGYFPKPDLARVSKGTGTTVKFEGVDCDGNGVVDIPIGSPLVCRLSATNLDEGDSLVPAIINLLDAVSNRSPVEMRVTRGDRVVGNVSPDHYANVLLQADNVLDFDIDYRCPLADAGRSFPVKVEALTKGNLLASATAKIVCRPEPEEPLPPLVDFITPLLVPVIAPPPPPPISQFTSVSQSQAQAQGAAAYQEQEQPQMAFVTAYRQTQEDLAEEYFMSSYEERRQIPAEVLVFGVGAATLALSFGFVSVARSRVRVRLARNSYR